MTHTNETNNEIIMSYVSVLLFSAQTKFLFSSPNAADQNRAIIMPTAHGGWSLILRANTAFSSAPEIICILKLKDWSEQLKKSHNYEFLKGKNNAVFFAS